MREFEANHNDRLDGVRHERDHPFAILALLRRERPEHEVRAVRRGGRLP